MNFFIFGGVEDTIFPPGTDTDVAEIKAVFSSLNLNYDTVVKYWVSAPGVGHWPDSRFHDVMMQYINKGTVASIDDFEVRNTSKKDKDGTDWGKDWDWGDKEKSDSSGVSQVIALILVLGTRLGAAAYFLI